MAVMIGVDPHKGSHTAMAVDATEGSLGELRVRSGPKQVDRLLGWAASFPEGTWAIENATGLGYRSCRKHLRNLVHGLWPTSVPLDNTQTGWATNRVRGPLPNGDPCSRLKSPHPGAGIPASGALGAPSAQVHTAPHRRSVRRRPAHDTGYSAQSLLRPSRLTPTEPGRGHRSCGPSCGRASSPIDYHWMWPLDVIVGVLRKEDVGSGKLATIPFPRALSVLRVIHSCRGGAQSDPSADGA